ncbi:ketimine reductase mu-crystallin [Drosophila guanche]|uniref:Ketimine reductase mu-crystallin n=1 Tax=Drosophila guanche TaxID=7266 RepID=A0A3B0J8E0_DROGU|nr:ketimine reductase mu-crystallin [Drosophila guanche]SPP78125.1 blast:Ketimine reductase mu-crystallin [Drosophila guanche]
MSNTLAPVYYSAETVRSFLTWPLVIEAVESALRAVVAMSVQSPNEPFVNQPGRSFTSSKEPGQVLLTMPAFVGNYKLTSAGSGGDAANIPHSTLACKLVTSFSSNPQRDPPLPSINANILLFSLETGELTTIMAGTDITTWRTVAASLVATKHLYFRRFGPRAEREREITVAIIGCGVQGQMHASAFCSQFKVKQLNLYNRTIAKAQRLSEQLQQTPGFGSQTKITVCNFPWEAVQGSDVICVATYSKVPLVYAADLRPDGCVHINAVGAGEIHYSEVADNVYGLAQIYVDSYANAQSELIGLAAPITAELGSVIKHGTLPAESAVTIFQSMGMASEDACVAQAVQDAILSSGRLPNL